MNYQVTIVGGGVAGALLALYLGKARVNTCLIDKGKPSLKLANPFVGRTTSLNLSSINSLREAGIWETIEKNSQQFEEIYVWDAEGSSSVQFNAAEISRKDLGVIVHNNIILEAIFNELEKIPEIRLIEEDSLMDVKHDPHKVEISTHAGLNIMSELLIGADGSLSKVRDLSQIPIRTWSYQQQALVASVVTEKSLNKTAFQIFTDTGPIALLPLAQGSNEASLIWSTDEEYGQKILKLERNLLMQELRLKTEDRFGEIICKEDIDSFPLHQLHAKKFYKGRSILVGDSAHTIHPLAGQGLNLGIADVKELSELLTSANRYGRALYDKEILRSYSKRREPESYKMIALMEAFKRGFGSENIWIKLGRSFAFDFANNTKALKQRLIKEAAGVI
ncbi:MAG: FAD-dependent monooxygenase [Gammaproteobacteria bacterium]